MNSTPNEGWIDSHCHLDFDDFELVQSLMSDLEKAGCKRVLVPAIRADFFQRVMNFQQAYPHLVDIAIGLHPYFIKDHRDDDLDTLNKWTSEHENVAIGEIGLDRLLDSETWEAQQHYFHAQVDIAKQGKRPLIIHCRKAHDQVASILNQKQFTYGGFIHGFSGSEQQAKRYINLGFKLGLGGALTHERAKAMHRMVKALPDDGFVLETDSPDMRPSFAMEAINTPLNVPKIAEHIAQLRKQDLEYIFQLTTSNYYSVIPNTR